MRRAHLGRIFDVKRMRSAEAAARSRAFGFCTSTGQFLLDRANRIMPVANHPSAAIRKHKFRGRGQKRLELRLDRLGNQPTRAGSQNFGERIVDRPFPTKGNNSILGHRVTLLLGGSGGLITNPVTPPTSHRHPVPRIAHSNL